MHTQVSLHNHATKAYGHTGNTHPGGEGWLIPGVFLQLFWRQPDVKQRENGDVENLQIQ